MGRQTLFAGAWDPGRAAPTLAAGVAIAVEERMRDTELQRARRIMAWVYGVAMVVAVIVAWPLADWHPLSRTALVDVVATLVVFAGSRLFDNSSMYDPYWSVLPCALAVWHGLDAPADANGGRQLLVLALVLLWGLRLTYNFLRGWGGLSHEDWRYRDFRGSWGRWYWPGSLLGIHMFPTLMTWLGCLALLPAMRSSAPLGLVDVAAVAVTVTAIAIEALADEQLLAFRRAHPQGGAICEVGLWARSRHPNYLGEVMFWVGLWLFAAAADSSAAGWTAIGPVAMIALFRFASIPLAERRSLRRRPGYAERIKRVPAMLPRMW